MRECDVERVEGIEPLMDRSDLKVCRCVVTGSPACLISLTWTVELTSTILCSHVSTG